MPFGGGHGMVLKPEVLDRALKSVVDHNGPRIYLSPRGRKFDQSFAKELSKEKGVVFICGRYEGVDERFIDKYVDEEISIGDFIMSGGEYGAICLIDSIARNLPGTIGNQNSVENDSFSNGFLKGPAYTRPEIFEDIEVPKVLLSGNHSKIKDWKEVKSLLKTYLRRPDLLNKVKLSKKQKDFPFCESQKNSRN